MTDAGTVAAKTGGPFAVRNRASITYSVDNDLTPASETNCRSHMGTRNGQPKCGILRNLIFAPHSGAHR